MMGAVCLKGEDHFDLHAVAGWLLPDPLIRNAETSSSRERKESTNQGSFSLCFGEMIILHNSWSCCYLVCRHTPWWDPPGQVGQATAVVPPLEFCEEETSTKDPQCQLLVPQWLNRTRTSWRDCFPLRPNAWRCSLGCSLGNPWVFTVDLQPMTPDVPDQLLGKLHITSPRAVSRGQCDPFRPKLHFLTPQWLWWFVLLSRFSLIDLPGWFVIHPSYLWPKESDEQAEPWLFCEHLLSLQGLYFASLLHPPQGFLRHLSKLFLFYRDFLRSWKYFSVIRSTTTTEPRN